MLPVAARVVVFPIVASSLAVCLRLFTDSGNNLPHLPQLSPSCVNLQRHVTNSQMAPGSYNPRWRPYNVPRKWIDFLRCT